MQSDILQTVGRKGGAPRVLLELLAAIVIMNQELVITTLRKQMEISGTALFGSNQVGFREKVLTPGSLTGQPLVTLHTLPVHSILYDIPAHF